jgi:hypothetical protein
VRLAPGEFNRPPSCCPVGAFAGIVFIEATLRIFGYADIIRAVGALEDVAEIRPHLASGSIRKSLLL